MELTHILFFHVYNRAVILYLNLVFKGIRGSTEFGTERFQIIRYLF